MDNNLPPAQLMLSINTRTGAKAKSASPRETKRRWTKDEDERLRQGVSACGPKSWKKISSDYLGDMRSDVQCLHRWTKVLKPGLVKGPWTDEEDSIILNCIDKRGLMKAAEQHIHKQSILFDSKGFPESMWLGAIWLGTSASS